MEKIAIHYRITRYKNQDDLRSTATQVQMAQIPSADVFGFRQQTVHSIDPFYCFATMNIRSAFNAEADLAPRSMGKSMNGLISN